MAWVRDLIADALASLNIRAISTGPSPALGVVVFGGAPTKARVRGAGGTVAGGGGWGDAGRGCPPPDGWGTVGRRRAGRGGQNCDGALCGRPPMGTRPPVWRQHAPPGASAD